MGKEKRGRLLLSSPRAYSHIKLVSSDLARFLPGLLSWHFLILAQT
jgi:hypothetical protein